MSISYQDLGLFLVLFGECVHSCMHYVVPTSPRYAPRWGCGDSQRGPSLPIQHLVHRGHRGTSSPEVGPPYAVALDTSHTRENEAWMVKAGGDLKSRHRSSFAQRKKGKMKPTNLKNFSSLHFVRSVLDRRWRGTPYLIAEHGQWAAAQL